MSENPRRLDSKGRKEYYIYGDGGGGWGAGYWVNQATLNSHIRSGHIKVKFEREWVKDEDGIAREVTTKKYVRAYK